MKWTESFPIPFRDYPLFIISLTNNFKLLEKGAMLIDTESTSKYDILISIKFVLQNKNQKYYVKEFTIKGESGEWLLLCKVLYKVHSE